MIQTVVETPIGDLFLSAEEDALCRIDFAWPDFVDEGTCKVLEMAREQLNAYFAGELKSFSLPLRPNGTAFQQLVWDQLQQIPYGTVCSYGELAIQIGMPRAARAVGSANNRNPLPIIVPCHRVIGANGKLVGYAGGLEKKQILLQLEQVHKAAATTRLQMR